MSNLGLVGAAGSQGVVDTILQMVARQKAEQLAAQARADKLSQQGTENTLARDKFGEDQRQFNSILPIQQGQLGVSQGNLALGRDKATEDVREFDAQAPDRAARTGLETAQTTDIQGRPAAAQTDYEHKLELQRIQNDADMKQIGAKASAAGAKPLSQNQELTAIGKLQGQWTAATKNAQTIQQQLSAMDAGMKAAERGDLAAGSQAVLVTFQKILDPTSVVRESEYMRSSAGLSLLNQMQGWAERLQTGGAGVPLAELQKFAQVAKEIGQSQGQGLQSVRKKLTATAEHYGLDPSLLFDDMGGAVSASPMLPAGQNMSPVNPTSTPGTIEYEFKNGKLVPKGGG